MPIQRHKFPTTVQHSEDYYLSVLLICIDGLKANQSHTQIAARLNDAGLRTPQALAWSAEGVKNTLKKVRLWRDYRSSFHAALLRLVYAGRLTVEQTTPLFLHRISGGY